MGLFLSHQEMETLSISKDQLATPLLVLDFFFYASHFIMIYATWPTE